MLDAYLGNICLNLYGVMKLLCLGVHILKNMFDCNLHPSLNAGSWKSWIYADFDKSGCQLNDVLLDGKLHTMSSSMAPSKGSTNGSTEMATHRKCKLQRTIEAPKVAPTATPKWQSTDCVELHVTIQR